MLCYILCVLIAAVSIVFLFFRKSFQYWDDLQINNEHPNSLMGNIKGIGTKFHQIEITETFYRKFRGTGKLFGLYYMNSPIAVITDLDLCRNMFVRDFASFHDRGMYYNEKDDPLSAHIFSLPGARWKTLRNKMTPTFTSGKLKNMFSTVSAVSDDLIALVGKKSDNNEPVNMKELSGRFTSDAISQCAFGIECNSLKNENSEVLKHLYKVFDANGWMIVQILFVNSFQKFSRWMGLPLFPKHVTSFFYNLFKETVETREKNNIQRNDFMNSMIQMMNRGSITGDDNKSEQDVGKITFNELAAQAFMFFFAGFETSSTAINFSLFELARNADIQERLRAEIVDVLAKHDGKITFDAVNEMPYLEQVFNGL